MCVCNDCVSIFSHFICVCMFMYLYICMFAIAVVVAAVVALCVGMCSFSAVCFGGVEKKELSQQKIIIECTPAGIIWCVYISGNHKTYIITKIICTSCAFMLYTFGSFILALDGSQRHFHDESPEKFRAVIYFNASCLTNALHLHLYLCLYHIHLSI